MKNLKKFSKLAAFAVFIALGLTGQFTALAATTPSLGTATTFGILASTYTNIAAGTINGDLGYTTPPAAVPTIDGTTHVADSTYVKAGIDQGKALNALNALTCDFTLNSATDLSLLSQPLTPGVYCIKGAQSIGTGGITLSGKGTYVFRSTGALNTVANSHVKLDGPSACDVFWTPGAATTLGANSTFIGTDIDDSGITVGSTVKWTGRALAFGETVTTNADTINVPTCATPIETTPSETSSVVKTTLSETSPAIETTLSESGPMATPKLPNAGIGPEANSNSSLNIIIPTVSFIVLFSIYLFLKKNTYLYEKE